MAKKNIKIVEMSVKDYVELCNATNDEKIDRHDVYSMIKQGELDAYKKGNAYVIRLAVQEEKVETNSVKEFTEKYNRRFPKSPVTEKQVRTLAAEGKIKAEKVKNKWVILESPRKKIK